ncbi:MAG: DEAD/DEAH box helicase, partial [Planctomycetes bacterium]|nr:DEAD/DEAH box helicase [Planctomycetota bacterium]
MSNYKIGSIVRARGREWIIIPSESSDYLKLKPFSGSALQTIAIPNDFISSGLEKVESSLFPEPDIENEKIGDYDSAQLIFLATKFLLRNAAVPLRCTGNISIQPKPYQLVPLVVALRQNIIRLMIADDVGVGKTIESLLIARELLDRGEINKICVITPPQLCDQWEAELKEKFSINAYAVKSSTIGSLERTIPPDQNIFEHLQHFVTSVDLIKLDTNLSRRFKESIPKIDLFIIDEAHGCAKPKDELVNLKLRYELIKKISEHENKHIILLTATPHSGVTQSFTSLLGVLNRDLERLDPESANDRRIIKPYLIQRTREDIRKSFNTDEHPFPEQRKPEELPYYLDSKHKGLIERAILVCKRLIQKSAKDRTSQSMGYWAAFSILRSISSSPDSAIVCLKKKSLTERHLISKKQLTPEFIMQLASPNVTDDPEAIFDDDPPETTLRRLSDEMIGSKIISPQDWKELEQIANDFIPFKGKPDGKLKKLTDKLNVLITGNRNVVVWCRYITTVWYLFEHLKDLLPKDVGIEHITGHDPDESKARKLEKLSESPKRILISTDCISEGVNLQNLFDSVIHYDLPLNPNRMEQRAGRIDRFGQEKQVKEFVMYSLD